MDTTLQWTQQILGNRFYFPVLNILSYGDHTSGEIHGAATRSYYQKMMRNCLAIGKLHCMIYRDLALQKSAACGHVERRYESRFPQYVP